MKIKKLYNEAKIPTYADEGAAGADLYAFTDSEVMIAPHKTVMIHTGGDRIVISTLKTGAITGAVDKKYLTKI